MGRVINADKFKEQVAAMTITENLPVKKANAMLKIIDMQSTAIDGKVKEAEFGYQRITHIYPEKHHYEELGEKPYIKHSCPVCDAVGNFHQVTPGDRDCPLCGVHLNWEN